MALMLFLIQPASSDSAPSIEATPIKDPPPSTPVTNTDKSSPPPISGGGEAKPLPPTDTNPIVDVLPDESSKPASTEGAAMVTSIEGAAMVVTPPKVTFSDIEKILGVDFKLDAPGTSL